MKEGEAERRAWVSKGKSGFDDGGIQFWKSRDVVPDFFFGGGRGSPGPGPLGRGLALINTPD